MKFLVRASTQKDFDRWVESVKRSSNVLDKTRYDQLLVPSESNPVEYFSAINKYLFRISIMKAMMPAKDVEALCKEKSWV